MSNRSSSGLPRLGRRISCARSLALGLAAAAALGAGATGQELFAQLSARAMPAAAGAVAECCLGDVDGDGDLDFVLTTVNAQDRLYRNDGDGVFADVTLGSLPPDIGWTTHAELVDVERDGDLDLVLSRSSGFTTLGSQNRLLLNDGSGRFTDRTATHMPVDTDKTTRTVAADVDGDGFADLIVANTAFDLTGAQNRLYLNDGTGRFVDATAGRLPVENAVTSDLAVGDVDGDGDQDFVTGTLFGTNPLRLHVNDGAGRFTQAPSRLPPATTNAYRTRLVDIDGDRDLDIVTFVDQALKAFVNDGAGVFTDETALRMPPGIAYPYAVGDLDGDGDVDFTVSTNSGAFLLLNDGAGRFGLSRMVRRSAGSIAADVDGDLDLDLVLPGSQDVLLNDGAAVFFDRVAAERRGPDLDGDPSSAAFGDVDGDGDLDVALTVMKVGASATDRLLLNDGRGVFVDAPFGLPGSAGGGSAVVMADVDLDGDPDILVGAVQAQRPTRLLLNDGRGGFTDGTVGRVPPAQAQTVALAVADVDGDGDPDLVEGNFGQSSRLLLNDGTGRFAQSPAGAFPVDQDGTRAVAVADVDGDGDPDLVFANSLNPTRLYLNDGTGRFADVSASRLPQTLLDGWGIGAADFDRDGDVDLVIADASGAHRLYRNDGTGTFIDATVGRLPAGGAALFVHVTDFDGDGDPDLVAGTGGAVDLYANDGAGGFTLRATLTDTGQPVGIADVDLDGDLDLLHGRESGPVGVSTSLLRQVHLSRLLRPGRRATVDVHTARRGPSPGLALPLFAPRPGRTPIPTLGVLGLDPTGVVAGAVVLLPPGAGRTSVGLGVPADRNLIGNSIFVQALVFDGVELRLTNATAVTFVQ